MKKNKKLLLLSSIICLLPTLAGIILYSKLPDQIPVQWGTGGDVSSFAPRWFPVAGMPGFLMLLNIYMHKKTDRDNNERNYPESMVLFLKWTIPALSVVCSGLSFAAALGFPISTAGIVGFIGVIFIILGWYIYGTSINSIGGILLPWSSADNEIRIKAQQLCMRTLIIGGAASALFSLMCHSPLALVSLLAALIVSFAGARRICSQIK